MPEAPFKVQVPDEELEYVKQRLQAARYPDQLQNIAPWEDGTDLSYLKASLRDVSSNPGVCMPKRFTRAACMLA